MVETSNTELGVAAGRGSPEPETPGVQAGGGEPERRARSARRGWTLWTAMALVAAAFFALCLAQAIVGPWDADTAAVSLQGWDLVHGHVLLHGWWSSDVNFYTFDAPLYGLCALVLGLSNLSLHVAGALIYTLVFLALCWLARGRATGSRYWLRVALVAYFVSSILFCGALRGTVLLVPDHLGTMVFLLIPFVLYDRYADRRWAAWAVFAVLTIGTLGDVTVRYVGVPALLLVWAAESRRTHEWRTPTGRLALAAAISVPVAFAVRFAEKAMGAYYLTPAKASISPPTQWGWHITSTFESLLSIYAVPISGFPGHGAERTGMTLFGLVALVCGLLSILRVALRWNRVESADRLLVAGIVVYLIVYCFSGVTIRGAGGGYEFIGVTSMMACLSARTISTLHLPRLGLGEGGRVRTVVAATTAAALAATGLLLSGTELTQTRQADPAETIAIWLEDHGYKYGLAGYWDAAPMTVYSHGDVDVRAVTPVPNGFVPYAWGAKIQWYQAQNAYANFVVAGGARNLLTVSAAESAFGTPAKVIQLPGKYTVLVYSYNLLTKRHGVHMPPGD